MPIIKTINLTKNYGKIKAVKDLNINIEEGEVFGFLGPNGAGKTTTIKMLSTLIAPTKGTAKVNGYDICTQQTKVRESIGIVFQEPSSDELLTGYENLKMHSLIYGIPKDEIEKRIEENLNLVELYDRKDSLVKTYSGGMRRRLEIARGLLHKPKVLFLDEPTLGLDPRGREIIWRYIKRLVKELEMTILLTTHYMEEADSLTDRVCIIDHGHAVITDKPEKLKQMMGGDLVLLTAKNLDIKKLKQFSFVKKIEKKKGRFLVTVENAAQNLQTILRNIDTEYVEVHRPTLGDVFLRFTGKGLEEEESSWFQKVIQYEVTNK
ncbi:MAG: ATP-binding cassette domain-containing protein [Candidatus Bilamarchaeaceae archaeon]